MSMWKSCCLLVDQDDWASQVADDMEAAVTSALDQGFRTGDLMSSGMKQASCTEMGKILLDSMRQPAMAH